MIRNCPQCKKELSYKSKDAFTKGVKNKLLCKSCVRIGKNNPMFGRKHSDDSKNKIKEKRKEQTFSDESREKMSESRIKHLAEYNSWNGKSHTDETRKKMRLSGIEYIRKMKGSVSPRYNVNSIPIIEEYGRTHGYNFQHAENGGEYHIEELGYWVDAYDKEKNVVLEYDEPRHKYYKNDEKREQEIKDYLNCKFIRIIGK